MRTSILVFIYLFGIGCFLWAWIRFANFVWPVENEDNYMIDDRDPDEGDRS